MNKVMQYMIYINVYKAENQRYKDTSYILKITQNSIYIKLQYINYTAKYQAFVFRYLPRVKAKVEV